MTAPTRVVDPRGPWRAVLTLDRRGLEVSRHAVCPACWSAHPIGDTRQSRTGIRRAILMLGEIAVGVVCHWCEHEVALGPDGPTLRPINVDRF